MKNVKNIAAKTKDIDPRHPLPLYYDIEKDTVYSTPGPGRHHVTNLINPNTEKDIIDFIDYWKHM